MRSPWKPLPWTWHIINISPICQEVTALLRLKGGKANKYMMKIGRWVGRGNGDL